MKGMEIVEISIGLIFIYLLLSLFTTVINEMIATFFKFRSNNLKKAICRLLDDDGQTEAVEVFFNHPLIKCLGKNNYFKNPSYLKSETFSKVVVDILKTGKDFGNFVYALPGKIDDLKSAVSNSGLAAETKALILSFATDTENDIDKFSEKLEDWFNESMERASGWYNKTAKILALSIGLILAIAFNADSITIVKHLTFNSDARHQLVSTAVNYIDEAEDVMRKIKSDSSANDSLNRNLGKLTLQTGQLISESLVSRDAFFGLGWSDANSLILNYPSVSTVIAFLLRLLGWLLTALAISLGAPFWFDLLNRFIKLRGAGKTGI